MSVKSTAVIHQLEPVRDEQIVLVLTESGRGIGERERIDAVGILRSDLDRGQTAEARREHDRSVDPHGVKHSESVGHVISNGWWRCELVGIVDAPEVEPDQSCKATETFLEATPARLLEGRVHREECSMSAQFEVVDRSITLHLYAMCSPSLVRT